MIGSQTSTSVWADYVIAKVRHSNPPRHIVAVQAARDTGSTIGPFQQQSRQDVVSMIESGLTFCTVEMVNGKYHRGADVKIVTIHGTKYIKTVDDGRPGDNLGNLPAF